MALALSIALTATGLPARAATSAVATLSGEFRDCPMCPEMVRVPAGTFSMGDESAAAKTDEKPVHAVTVAAFAAGKYEITVGEYAAFVAATNRETLDWCRTDRDHDGRWQDDATATWRDPGFPQTDRHPVVCVTWADANPYAAWLTQVSGKSYRLLTEPEWEYAGRSGTTAQFFWGDDPNGMCAYANGPDQAALTQFPNWPIAACNDGQVFAAPVGSYRPNAFGLYDTAGNVWEWTQDCYTTSYAATSQSVPSDTITTCPRRALRGGSWVRGLVDLRSSQRNGLPPPQIRGGDIGFRVARSPP
ncbi:MAG: formylglycine-generating enzyme family protein [Pseudomonadota bacterium]